MKSVIAFAIGFFGPIIVLAIVVGFFSAIGLTSEWLKENAYPLGDFWRGAGLLIATGIIAICIFSKVFP